MAEITQQQILDSADRVSLKADAVLEKLDCPMTYTYNEKEVTIKESWKDDNVLWLNVSVKGMDLGNQNPFGFVNPPMKVGIGKFETLKDEEGNEYQREIYEFNPLGAIKEALDQLLGGKK